MFERKVSNYSIDKKELSQLNLNIKECKESSIDCLLKFEKFFKKVIIKLLELQILNLK